MAEGTQWQMQEKSMVEAKGNGSFKEYRFDRVFAAVAQPVVRKALEGVNGTVFTYGQTGSGKTHSILGTPGDPGIIRLAIRDLFGHVAAHAASEDFTLRVSYLEVYNEEINDLLNSDAQGRNLRITTEDVAKGVVISGLLEEQVESADDALGIVARGEANRAYGSTNMNDNSSRSHVIYRVHIVARERAD